MRAQIQFLWAKMTYSIPHIAIKFRNTFHHEREYRKNLRSHVILTEKEKFADD